MAVSGVGVGMKNYLRKLWFRVLFCWLKISLYEVKLSKSLFVVILLIILVSGVALGQLWRYHQVEPQHRAETAYLLKQLQENKLKLREIRRDITQLETDIGLFQEKGKGKGGLDEKENHSLANQNEKNNQ